MDREGQIVNNYEKVDHIYLLIKKAGKVSLNQLYTNNEDYFKKSMINIEELTAVLEEMSNQKYVLKTSDNFFLCNPLKFDFISFRNEYFDQKRMMLRSKIYETTLKILPIVTTIVFGVITVIMSFANYKLAQTKAQESQKSVSSQSIIDTTQIKKLDTSTRK